MMLSCKQAAQLASQRLDRKLGPWERLTLRLHLAICNGCANFSRQAAFVRKAMKRLAD
jgi:hypothetical protein